MSTSERGAEAPAAENAADSMNLGAARSLPDVAALTQMANAFFRALPGQAVAAAPFVPATPAYPAPAALPAMETRLPQFGEPLPALSSVDGLPSSPDLSGFGELRLMPEEIAPRPSPALRIEDYKLPQQFVSPAAYEPSQFVAGSPFSLPLPAFDVAGFAGFPGFPGEQMLRFAPETLFDEAVSQQPAAARHASSNSYYFLDEAGQTATKPAKAWQPTRQRLEDQAESPRVAQPLDLELAHRQFDIGSVRRDFPILRERVNGRPLIWLDNAATTQKPQSVIDRIAYFYEHENSNIHRAAHELAARATDAYEDARSKVAHFLNASSSKEIVFVRGATEAINLVAQSWGRRHIQKDDEIVISWIEHHANIVPWQMLAAEKGARLRVAPVDDDGQILLDEFEKLLNPKTRMVSVTQVSNALGTITPVHRMVEMGHRHGARVLVDGSQAVSHMPIDVQSLDCDFYVFSGHKVFAPTGIGALYGKPEALAEAPPWQGGGNMIVDVTFEKTIYHAPPSRFEAGTGNIADAVGLGAAIDYLDRIGMANVARYEHELLVYATQAMLTVPGLRMIGTAKEKAGVLSFVLEGFRTEEVGAALNREGIAVRSGHHCAQPTLRRFGLETTVRPSLALYNNYDDIDAMIAALFRLKRQGA